ncbi:MAG: hypothetical protein AMXMBFR77_11300 [Phycisphaerales bacterium]|nr:hypothetical protein [Leptolyngbya sp.]MCQ3941114.1 hypothetical protein [cyanobacterium CYA1]MCZ7633180.1 hypothetical protein [Phycisphaerales bacterium]MDL1905397.1 hypothetical protein [Synechococcales cyanobacterium CNB]GIK18342.1 MAG: hypothetical protein BroJett004_05060 [Planctomycetota bacterium]
MRGFIALGAAASVCMAASAQVAYVSGTGGEPWGMPGNVNALNDVFGGGGWTRLDFPTAVGNGIFTNYDCIIMDGGNGADAEFNAFVNANRAAMEAFVAGGGKMLINAARWGSAPMVLDVGFGVFLDNNFPHDFGNAVDTSHPIYQGPFGVTGGFFDGDYLAHDIVYGSGLTDLMFGSSGPDVILAEKSYGAGHVVFGGLTLPFFGEHPLWTDNTDEFHRNLYYYVCNVPSPSGLAVLALGLPMLRRRR